MEMKDKAIIPAYFLGRLFELQKNRTKIKALNDQVTLEAVHKISNLACRGSVAFDDPIESIRKDKAGSLVRSVCYLIGLLCQLGIA